MDKLCFCCLTILCRAQTSIISANFGARCFKPKCVIEHKSNSLLKWVLIGMQEIVLNQTNSLDAIFVGSNVYLNIKMRYVTD